MSVLTIKDVTKLFPGGTRAVDSFSLEVANGELVCLLGPSGSGKSTLLRMVGGFETPSSGLIAIDGEDITRVPPEKRPTGMVFQSHALWTHMDVFKNLAFGLKLRRLPADEIKRKVFGLNAARLHGLDPAAGACRFDKAELQEVRFQVGRKNQTYGPTTASAVRLLQQRGEPWERGTA